VAFRYIPCIPPSIPPGMPPITSFMYVSMIGLNSSWNQGTVEGVMEEVRIERYLQAH